MYDYEFKCPSCGTHISFDEQCIISKIQKKCNNKILSQSEIKSNYDECKEKYFRGRLASFVLWLIFILTIVGIITLLNLELSAEELWAFIGFYSVLVLLLIFINVGYYQGKSKSKYRRNYAPEKEALLKKYHAYCSSNKELIINSDKCYCFHCKELVDSDKVTYIGDGKTGLCPNCGVDSLIPDNIEGITKELIDEMNEYWF